MLVFELEEDSRSDRVPVTETVCKSGAVGGKGLTFSWTWGGLHASGIVVTTGSKERKLIFVLKVHHVP